METWIGIYVFGGVISGLFTYVMIDGMKDRVIWSILAALVWPIIAGWLIWKTIT